MSFRGRLFIFFTIIVIVPMAAVAVVLFKVTSDSETGKSDSRIAQGPTTVKGKRVRTLAVSRTTATDYVRSVKRLTALEASVTAAGARVAATSHPAGRSRFQQVRAAPLPPISIGMFDRVDTNGVASSR